jgi:16S rRNA (guanine1516-N2)-methyltransferase
VPNPHAPSAATPATLAVCADPHQDLALLKAAARLAVDLSLPLEARPPTRGYEMLLVAAPGRLELRVLTGDASMRGGRAVAADLSAIDTRSPAGRSLKQPIIKAVGIKSATQLRDQPPTILDATAGWGGDAYLLAALGCRVLAVERNQVVATLLRDGVLRAGLANPALLGRLTVVAADGRPLLRRLSRLRHGGAGASESAGADDLPPEMRAFLAPDVVYLDPMFPGAAGRKTAERKPMRVLRRLVGADADAGELLDWALGVAGRRVVVKRPRRAPALTGPGSAGREPDVVFAGKSLRFDVYLVAGH